MKSIYIVKIILIITIVSFLMPLSSFSGTYWVSPIGTANWSDARSSTPLSEIACSPLSAASNNAIAGDVIVLRGGTYRSPIAPVNSGNSGKKIIWKSAEGELAVLGCDTPQSDTYYYGILLNGVDYHVIERVEVDCGFADNAKLVVINNGSDYNEIKNSEIHGGGMLGNSGIHIKDSYGDNGGSKHNWIHGCKIYEAGYIDSKTCNDMSNLIKIGNYNEDYNSHHNTIENNVLYSGGHHILETYTKYNVIRNNVSHNEGWMTNRGLSCTPKEPDERGKWGNRNFQIYDGNFQAAMYNLIEGNRLGHAGPPPDGNGANNLVITSPTNIVRYNVIYNAGEKNIHLKQGTGADSENNRIYNNSSYKTTGIRPGAEGIFFSANSKNNVVKNNIFYDSYGNDIGLKADGNTIINNWVTASGDPQFLNPDISDPNSLMLPNLSLQLSSPAINAGIHLTLSKGSGTNSKTLIVDDALYFQDGSLGSSLARIDGDYIAIGTVDNTVKINFINYNKNTITLANTKTWNDKAKVWLVKKSDGKVVLYGPAPDIGAHELTSGSEKSSNMSPSAPAAVENIRVRKIKD